MDWKKTRHIPEFWRCDAGCLDGFPALHSCVWRRPNNLGLCSGPALRLAMGFYAMLIVCRRKTACFKHSSLFKVNESSRVPPFLVGRDFWSPVHSQVNRRDPGMCGQFRLLWSPQVRVPGEKGEGSRDLPDPFRGRGGLPLPSPLRRRMAPRTWTQMIGIQLRAF